MSFSFLCGPVICKWSWQKTQIEKKVAPTSTKKQKFLNKLEQVLSSKTTIRDTSSLLGRIVATFKAAPNGRLYYKNIESDKISALK